MLQQTRVEAVIPYYVGFLQRFPSLHSLAAAPEDDVLAAWSGLGYYSRARNLHKTARQLANGGLPDSYEDVSALPGVGPYTAAAIASIALNLPCAAVDGNVTRVISRLTNNPAEISSVRARRQFSTAADDLLDPARPGDFNQAMMELGATICLPGIPDCPKCPVEKFCAARAAGTERALPVRLKKQTPRDVALDLALIEGASVERIFLVRRSSAARRLPDFWELPEKDVFAGLRFHRLGEFRHQIVNDRFRVKIWGAPLARVKDLPPGRWFDMAELKNIPVTTITKKALLTLTKKE